MTTTRHEIANWIEDAPEGTTHVLIVTDTYDYEDFPVYVDKKMDVREEVERRTSERGMSKVMEVYNMSMPIADQLKEHRAWHMEKTQ